MTKLEKETRQQLYVFIKKLSEIRANSARIHLHAGMSCQLSYYNNYEHDTYTYTYTVGPVITNHIR